VNCCFSEKTLAATIEAKFTLYTEKKTFTIVSTSTLTCYELASWKVPRGEIYYKIAVKSCSGVNIRSNLPIAKPQSSNFHRRKAAKSSYPAPGGVSIPLYQIAHGRTGDKGNNVNISLIPHCPRDIDRLTAVITHGWVAEVMQTLFVTYSPGTKEKLYGAGNSHSPAEDPNLSIGQDMEVEIYRLNGVSALNLVISNVLDGGVTCSRRIDRHGKSLSDLILRQWVTLPP
jgi:hypothetical protein